MKIPFLLSVLAFFHVAVAISMDGTKKESLTKILECKEIDPTQATEYLIGELLERFIIELKSFLHGRYFESLGFESDSHLFAESLSIIGKWVENMEQKNNKLSKQLEYAKYIFHTMTETVHILRFYSNHNKEQHLLRLVVQLKVGLFELFDSYGKPNLEMKGYRETVVRYKSKLHVWREEFMVLENVPLSVKFLFESLAQKVVVLLNELSVYY